MIKTKMYIYWKSRLLEEAKLCKSLKFMDKHLMFGKVHPLAKSTTYNIRDIARIPIRLKIVTGNYILQSDKSAFSIAFIMQGIQKLTTDRFQTVTDRIS
jgi:hypothetical protein